METQPSFIATRPSGFQHSIAPILTAKDYSPLENHENHWNDTRFTRPVDKLDKPRFGGTDPAKYKTSICRNWETTGVCTFRGCTFAHGKEELRPSKFAQKNEQHITAVMAHACAPIEDDCKTQPGRTPLPTRDRNPSSVDTALQTLCEAIRQERAAYETTPSQQYELEILLRREQMSKIQREKDQHEITALHERIQHLEKIIIQLHIEKSSAQSKEEKKEEKVETPNSQEESIETPDAADSLNTNLTLLSLLQSVNRIPGSA
mmetsp:Transcript_34141/g.53384  ORF Transcript_34141/g.53384 Transcript_34141/m.53384 type:complete len:262 (-) Transcript_34141:239-1024(-)